MRELKIDGKTFYLLINKTQQQLDCLLYDGKDSWHESGSLSNILERGKISNKKIKYPDDIILRTLQKETPVEANWLVGEEHSLKVKYNVQNRPLYFTWQFKRQSENEFQKLMIFRLLSLVKGLTKQNEELWEVVLKKDTEIKQYKTEGAVLKRVTVATKKFDSDAFKEKYADLADTNDIISVADSLCQQEESKQTSPQCDDNPPSTSAAVSSNNDVKLTPRRKRRKMLEDRERIIAEKIKARGRPLEYESSQSQSLSTSSPEILDEDKPKTTTSTDDIKERRNSPPSSRLRVQNDLTQNRSARSPILRKKPKVNYMEYGSTASSSEDDNKISSPTKSDKNNIISKKNSSSPSKEILDPTKSDEAKLHTSPTNSKSPLNAPSDQLSDIQTIIDEWKQLEQRRIADLHSMRTMRNGKRISH